MLTLFGLAVSRFSRWRSIRPHASTVLVCALGLALRAPAFMEPAGVVGADGSLQAILVQVILKGPGPAPVFLETSSYQGSLKAHLGALASLVAGRDDLGLLVVIGSSLLWTLLTASAMSLGRRLGGEVPAVVTGLFLALSPRFATVFSVNNVGEYPDALGLGTWAMAWAAAIAARDTRGFEARGAYFGIGLLLGIAIWQQPISASFGVVALGLLGVRAVVLRDPWFLAFAPGLILGRLPVTIHDAGAVASNSQAVGVFLRSAGQALPLKEHLQGTVEWALPTVLSGLSNDSTWTSTRRMATGLAWVGLLLLFVGRATGELRDAMRNRSFVVVRVMAAVQVLAALGAVWLISGGGQYSRPRYFLPILAGFAIALGDVIGALWRRSPVVAVCAASMVIGSNALSNVGRIAPGLEEGRSLRALAERIEALGLKTGYSGIAIAGPLTMLTNERVSVDGVLNSPVGERLPARHVERVLRYGPDFYVATADEAPRLAQRLESLGVTYTEEGESLRLFHHLSRRVPLLEVQD